MQKFLARLTLIEGMINNSYNNCTVVLYELPQGVNHFRHTHLPIFLFMKHHFITIPVYHNHSIIYTWFQNGEGCRERRGSRRSERVLLRTSLLTINISKALFTIKTHNRLYLDVLLEWCWLN